MAGFEIVAPEASGEAVFSGFTLKWLSAFKTDKMVKKGGLSIHLQKAPKLSKEWGEGHGPPIRQRRTAPSLHQRRSMFGNPEMIFQFN